MWDIIYLGTGSLAPSHLLDCAVFAVAVLDALIRSK